MRYYAITLLFDKVDSETNGIFPASPKPRSSIEDAIKKGFLVSKVQEYTQVKATGDSIRVYKQADPDTAVSSYYYTIIVSEGNMLFNLGNFYFKFGDALRSDAKLDDALLFSTFLSDYIKSITGITQL